MWEFLERFFGGQFMPHGHCYLWSPAMVWTQVTSNTLIGLAYVSISITLATLVRRVKLRFSWVYIAFGAFILACGMTHFLDVATVWHPIYWLDAGMRSLTAVASVTTAVLLFPLFRRVVAVARLTASAAVANEELRKSEERLRLLIEAVNDYAIFTLDPKGIVTSWNPGAQRFKGYRAQEIIGLHFSKFYPEEDVRAGKCERELEEALRVGRFEDEGWRVRSDGSRFWANVIITPMRDPSSRLIGFAKVSRDLTERRKAEVETARLAAENAALQERARTQEFQERFLAILGHDLRNPLAAIDMGVGLLRTTANPQDGKILDRMTSSSQRMTRMIEQILDLTRSRLAGGIEMQRTSMDVGDVLSQVVDELRVAHPSCEVILKKPSAIRGSWDRDRLEQLFSNLVGNAIQHGVASSPVTIDVDTNDSAVTVAIHNDGTPIPEELRAKLFDPFRRGDRDSRTSRTSGLGLGLYISREIVSGHGGTLDVTSSAEAGTTFRVTLPLVPKKSMIKDS